MFKGPLSLGVQFATGKSRKPENGPQRPKVNQIQPESAIWGRYRPQY